MNVCSSCGRPVLLVWTETGRQIPLDYEPDPAGNFCIDRVGDDGPVVRTVVPGMGDRRSHLVTCPNRQIRRVGRR